MTGGRSSLPWWTLLAFVVAAVAGQLGARPSPDVAWNLYAGRELLHGSKLGVDLFENTPPMIFALKVPAVALAGLLGIPEWPIWAVLVSALSMGVIALVTGSGWCCSRSGLGPRLGLVAVLAMALLLIPGADYGQRDHLTGILVLPYVLLVSGRVAGANPGVGRGVLAGLLAAIGIGIKPHFVLLPIALFLFESSRIGIRRALNAEHLTIAAVGALYVGTVWALVPEYFSYALEYGPLYGRFLSLPIWASAVMGDGVVWPWAALGVYTALRRLMSSQARPLADSLAAATACLLVVAILQGKGWRYHTLPAIVFAALLAALCIAQSIRRSVRGVRRLYFGLGVGALSALVAGAAPSTLRRVYRPHSVELDQGWSPHLLLPLVQAVGPSGYVAILSTNIATNFPVVLEGGARWAFRHPNFWPLIAFYADEVRGTGLITPRRYEERGFLERQFSDEVVADLIRTRPRLLLVLRPEPMARGGGGARRVDYLEYFSSQPLFLSEVFAGYQPAGQVGDFDVYWRRGEEPGPLAASPAPVGRGLSLREWTQLLTGLGFAFGFAVGLVATRLRPDDLDLSEAAG